jgi:hypothetical protein
VYVYLKASNSWLLQEKLLPKDPGENEHFGQTLSISGSRIAIGATGDHWTNNGLGIYLAVRSKMDHETKISPSDQDSPILASESHLLDGDNLLGSLAGRRSGEEDAGAVYVFEGSGPNWRQIDKLIGPISAGDNWFVSLR